jgi:hypothetical protein
MNIFLIDIPIPPPSLNTFINVPPNHLPLSSVPTSESWPSPNTFSTPTSSSMVVESQEELKSPSTEDSITTETPSQVTLNENDMKTDFVNFRKKQFETGHVENVVRDPQRESKTKQYSEKKKYENEWNRLTAVADVETVMERASHFEDIDPDKFARLKSKLPTSPPIHEQLNSGENFMYDFHPNYFYDSQPQFKIMKPSPRKSSLDAASAFTFPRGECVRFTAKKRSFSIKRTDACFLSF